jgi:hypothetical protein
MFGRLFWKLILAFSVAVAVALLLIALRTRRSDLVVSGARGGTYRELRFGGGNVGVMTIPGWPVEQRWRAGRPPAANPADLKIGRIPQSAAGPTLALLDGAAFT